MSDATDSALRAMERCGDIKARSAEVRLRAVETMRRSRGLRAARYPWLPVEPNPPEPQ